MTGLASVDETPRAGVPPGDRWWRRVAWAGAAQGASSFTNLVLYLGLLRSSTPADFGRWVAVLSVYHLAIAIGRGLISEAMVASARPFDPTNGTFSWGWACRRFWSIGFGASALMGLVAVGLGATSWPFVAVALAMPVIVRQDGQRSLAWARSRPALSVALDSIWITTVISGSVVAVATDRFDGDTVAVIWLLGGVASTLFGFVVIERGAPSRRARSTIDVGSDRVLERLSPAGEQSGSLDARLHARRRSYAAIAAGRTLLPVVVALILGPVAAGLLKTSILPFTPILSLSVGLRVVILPAMQRAAEADAALPGSLNRIVTRVVGLAGVMTILGVAITVVVVEALPQSIVGSTVQDNRLLLPGAVLTVSSVVSILLADGVGFGSGSQSVLVRRLVELLLEWAAVFAAATLVAVDAVAIGWAAGAVVGVVVWLSAGRVSPSVAASS